MNKKSIIGIVAVIIIIIILASFSNGKSKEPRSLKIGVIDVLSGQYATLGENMKKGIELAASEFQTAHPETKVELIFEDDGFDTAKALSAEKKLVEVDKVNALIVATSPSINAIYPVVSKLPIPVVTYGAQSTPETKDNVFHIFPDSITVDYSLGNLVRTLVGSSTQKVVGVYTNDATPVKFYSAFQSGYGADIPDFNLDPGTKDVRTVATKVLAEKPQFIFMTNYADLGAQFIKEVTNLTKGKTKPTFIFDLTLNEATSEYEKLLGSNLSFLDGSLVVSLKKADATAFNAAYKAKYNADPGQLADYGYDAFNLLLASRKSDPVAWVEALGASKVTGSTGDISFDPVGKRLPVFGVGQMKDGKIPEYK